MRNDFGHQQARAARVSNISSAPVVTTERGGGTALGRPGADHIKPRALLSVGARFWFSSLQALTIMVSSVVAGVAYHEVLLGAPGSSRAYLAVGILAGILYGSIMHIADGTRRLRNPNGPEALRDVSLVWFGVLLLITFVVFALKAGGDLSRGTILSFLVIGYVAVLVTRYVAPGLIAVHTRSAYRAHQEILVIGVQDHPAFNTLLSTLTDSGYRNPTVIELGANCIDSEWEAKLPVSLGKIYALARMNAHGDICVAAGGLSESRLRNIIDALRVIPRAVHLVPDSSVEALLHLPIRSIGELRSVEMQKSPMNVAQRCAKRGIDFVISLPLIIFISPLLVAIALAIKFDSKGPVFFWQRRLGYRGLPFAILKFRTMSVLEDGASVRQATKDDSRITRVGRWLRKASLDELPQLINVIRGEMSLVGPRPHAVAHDQLYAKLIEHYEVRQHVKPGITGWAQVNGLRGETASVDAMRRRVEFDMWYAKNASVWFDIKILLLTIVEILHQRNAH